MSAPRGPWVRAGDHSWRVTFRMSDREYVYELEHRRHVRGDEGGWWLREVRAIEPTDWLRSPHIAEWQVPDPATASMARYLAFAYLIDRAPFPDPYTAVVAPRSI